MYGPSDSEWRTICLMAVIVLGLVGYGVGKLVEWIASHLSVAWNWA